MSQPKDTPSKARELAEILFWNTVQVLNVEMGILKPASSEAAIRAIESLLQTALEEAEQRGMARGNISNFQQYANPERARKDALDGQRGE